MRGRGAKKGDEKNKNIFHTVCLPSCRVCRGGYAANDLCIWMKDLSTSPRPYIYIYIFIIRHFGGEWGFFFSFPGKVNCCCFEIRNPRLREFPLSFLFMLMSFLFFGQTV